MSVHNHYIGININSIQYYFTFKFIAVAERKDLPGLRSFLFENLNGKLDLGVSKKKLRMLFCSRSSSSLTLGLAVFKKRQKREDFLILKQWS